MDIKEQITLTVINEFLHVFKISSIKSLKELPKIEKILFENHKNELNLIIDKYIEKLHEHYHAKEISFYDRKRMRNYSYTLFKKLYESNGHKLNYISHKKQENNSIISKNYICL